MFKPQFFDNFNWKVILIVAVSCFPYGNVINAPFLHDDIPAVLKNPDVQVRNNKKNIQFCRV